ncbi:MAG TPA: hypothetical protein GX501_00790 [Clostridiaceae bacterium]|nr:hypothetical protein [Clostridiaceae bacterium]
MDYIRKLPLLLALFSAIVTGLAGYANRVGNKENMANMVIVMLVFYIAGLYIRSTIFNIADTIKKKAEEREIEEKKRLAEEKKKAEEEERAKSRSAPESKVDVVVDDNLGTGIGDSDFDELPIAEYIKNELGK